MPVGGEFQVSTYTTGNQDYPSVAVHADGHFVIVWHSQGSSGSDTSFSSIQGQRFASDGTPQVSQFQVNSDTTLYQRDPEVAVDGSGNFVVVWGSDRTVSYPDYILSIQGQRFSSDGTPLGGEFQVNSYPRLFAPRPSVAVGTNGEFLVAWHAFHFFPPDNSDLGVFGQWYDSDGAPAGAEFLINSFTLGDQRDPSVASDPAGNFVVVWLSGGSSGSDTSSTSIQGQRYATDRSPLGSEFQINVYTTNSQLRPSVTTDGSGNFIVVWQSFGSVGPDDSSTSIQGQRFSSEGPPLGSQFQVNTYTTGFQAFASVSAASDGSFVVAWRHTGSKGTDDGFSVQAQRYVIDNDGACCLQFDLCLPGIDEQVCTLNGGEFKGPATGCELCSGQATGACCSRRGFCIPGTTRATCHVFAGSRYQGDGSTCTPDPC